MLKLKASAELFNITGLLIVVYVGCAMHRIRRQHERDLGGFFIHALVTHCQTLHWRLVGKEQVMDIPRTSYVALSIITLSC